MLKLEKIGKAFFILIVLATVIFTLGWMTERPVEQRLGVTFSTVYARQLGLDSREVFLAVLDDLQTRRVRLPVYWSEVEPDDDRFVWDELDWMMAEAEKREVAVTLAVGAKVPRWPECYIPDWAENGTYPFERAELEEFLRAVVERYKGSRALVRWQVENEPYFYFGVCPEFTSREVEREVELVRSLDSRPIMMTASGEAESWLPLAKPADVLGISVYRVTWNNIIGYFRYPLPPWFYRLRAFLISGRVDEVVISELQAEPWLPVPVESRTAEEWSRLFTPEDLRDHVDYAAGTDIPEAYLWGAEWWFYLKQHGQSRLWEEARMIFSRPPSTM